MWLLSTWCGSCAAGLDTLSRHATALGTTNLRVVVRRNYRNGGYPGADLSTFVSRVVPQFRVPDDRIMGQASKSLDQAYNASHYPDIHFLIDATGRIRQVDGAPSATMDRILRFAREQE